MAPPLIRDNVAGVYGHPTSTMDWCEENYAITYVVGEFWNTVSNWIMIFPPMIVAYHMWRFEKCETRYIASFTSLMVIGIGSFAFHCTLLYQSQLLDELPMIYGTAIMIYAIMEIKGKENQINLCTAALFTLLSFIITMIYISFVNPLIFLWSYGLMAAALFSLNAHGLVKYKGHTKLFVLSSASYFFGFILWNIDNEYCFNIRALRSSLPGILRPTTQLHALWHTFAGIGTYCQIMYSVHLRIKCLGYIPKKKFVYGYIFYYEKDAPHKKYDINGNFTGKVNHLPNGKSNGFHANGKLNGFLSKGKTNGFHSNGKTNGYLSNGLH